ncbi:MAG: class I SAM-dependent methyltransferase [Bacteroidota bacterium]|nr:class I SAM-dependent methyltransferase [Bacteroidota bacterium]
MTKKLLLLLLLVTLTKLSYSQSYYVTFIKGSILYEHKPLKLHDQVNDQALISSGQPSAELELFSLKNGKRRLRFANAKLVAAGAGHSELYELIVGNYLEQYSQTKIMGTKDAEVFDLQVFLNDTSKNPVNHIALVEGQSLPLQSQLMKFIPGDKYFICSVGKKDTACTAIPVRDNSLLFDSAVLKELLGDTVATAGCIFKIGYTDNGVYKEQSFPDPIQVSVISREQLQAVIASYKAGLTGYYKGDKSKLVADVEDNLTDYYGKFYRSGVDRIILSLLN